MGIRAVGKEVEGVLPFFGLDAVGHVCASHDEEHYASDRHEDGEPKVWHVGQRLRGRVQILQEGD